MNFAFATRDDGAPEERKDSGDSKKNHKHADNRPGGYLLA